MAGTGGGGSFNEQSQNKDLSDFLLREYESIANAHFNAHEMLSKWVRFYFLVAAAPVTLAALAVKNGKWIDLNGLPTYSYSLVLLVGGIGFLISLITFDTRLDASLYARSVNGIRKYFVDRELGRAVGKAQSYAFDPSAYIVLPTDISKPSFGCRSLNAAVFVLMFGVINSLYMCFGIYGLLSDWGSECRALFVVLVGVVIMAAHALFYALIGRHKEKTYTCTKDKT